MADSDMSIIKSRKASVTRTTRETDISVDINIDGEGLYEVNTGIGFFDHMLNGFARHGFMDLNVTTKGDTWVDGHHTVEDTGIVLGQAFLEALGDKKGIKRFGHCILPMDDALVMAAVDLSGRHYFEYDLPMDAPMVGDFDTELVKEFFYSFSDAAKINLHIKKINGNNAHHIIEATFKAVARAIDMAVALDERNKGVPSTKGVL
ncbi:MAG: imidazoleglycerol-phosphate dehydratase HisB [Lachnospiraceae bacterium]|nr:imidazoleglycerol-phosphate dehydratase HisB [Lachnoclostridium sp.]MDD7521332.1 imidazoleglycerol-phosphate dehydratase HisB [Lachnoclostridium sp.]MDY2599038.1 imidazoleglycerol-phosphate dehydratase HisB [Lachnospiraceae bacterium]